MSLALKRLLLDSTVFARKNVITWHTVSGEEKAADEAAAATWREENFWEVVEPFAWLTFSTLTRRPASADFFLPRHCISRGKSAKAARSQKLSVTALCSCNVTGTEKLEPLVTERFQKPHRTSNAVSLPCEYRATKRAWITRELFTEWLLNVDKNMREEGRKTLMTRQLLGAHCQCAFYTCASNTSH